jgi:hypothetical protein
MTRNTFTEPRCYFTTDGAIWAVIYQGMPICNNKATREEAQKVADQMRLTPDANHHWNGTLGQWVARALAF